MERHVERPGATTLRGNPLTVLGPALKPGEKAPDFKAVDDSLKDVVDQLTSEHRR